jgi:5'-nucleotidase
MTKNYKWILFDADETLFNFDSLTGLKHMFKKFGVDFTEDDFAVYQKLNKQLWTELQNGLINQKELQARRFHLWAEKLTSDRLLKDPTAAPVTTEELNNAYLDSMAITSSPLDGAVNLLNALRGKVKLGIITNGFARLQEARLNHLGLRDYFDLLVISEVVGCAKPHKEIFDYTFSQIGGEVSQADVLMVGDTLESDILGGMNAGIDTFWLNAQQKTAPDHISPTYQASSLKEIENFLLRMFV